MQIYRCAFLLQNPERRVAYEAELAENIQRIRMELTELDEKYVTILAETKRVQAEKRRKKEVTDAVLADVTWVSFIFFMGILSCDGIVLTNVDCYRLRLEGARELRDKKRAELAGVKEMNDRNRFTLKLLNENFAKMSLPKDNKWRRTQQRWPMRWRHYGVHIYMIWYFSTSS